MAIYTTNNKIWKLDNKWVNKPDPVPPGPSFDEVTIGTQTWMATELNIDDGQGGIYTADNLDWYVNSYGGSSGRGHIYYHDKVVYYYNVAAANRVVNNISGWHLPTQTEWETLFSYVNSSGTLTNRQIINKLAGVEWGYVITGTDDYGMNLLPLAYYSISYQGVDGAGEELFLLNADNSLFISSSGYEFRASDTTGLTIAYPIRLIKDS